MNPLSDESKKRLTNFLDGCAHIWVQDGHVSHHKCSECGEECRVRREFLPKMRTFTTGNDMLALKEKIVEKGMWDDFEEWTFIKWDSMKPFSDYSRSLGQYADWLISPAKFIPLVDEFLKEKEVEITVQKLQIIAMSTEITEKEEQIAALQKRERVLIDRLQSHGDVETDKEMGPFDKEEENFYKLSKEEITEEAPQSNEKYYECPECGSAVPHGMKCHHNL